MEKISMESLDLNNKTAYFSERPDLSPDMSAYEKRRYRNKLLFVWGIPLLFGIFSFIYWFAFIPLVWSALPHQHWPTVWFTLYGLVAFVVWLAIMALCFLLWRHKYNTIVKCARDDDKPYLKASSSKASSNDSGFKDSPPFPTKVGAVQPLSDTPNSSFKDHRGSSVCIPVQSDNTPSLYNSRTGRESYEAGYQLDSESTSPSVVSKQDNDKQNSGILLLKKMDSLKGEVNKKNRISSSGSEGSNADFKKVTCYSGDGLKENVPEDDDALEGMDAETIHVSRFQTQVSVEKSPAKTDEQPDFPAPLTREESFKGLPEMNPFGEYLQLVTIETPVSPREAYFSDIAVSKAPEPQEIQMRAPRDRKSYCVGDLSAAQQRITEARKSVPLFMYASDIESGSTESPPSVTTPPPAILEVVDESPKSSPTIKEYKETAQVDESVPPAKAATSPGSKDNGKYFIASVLRTESITSEVRLNIEDRSPSSNGPMSWETKLSASPIPEEDSGIKWVVLSRDYAANNLGAFIRLESEAMARERSEGISPHFDDVDNDSVFLEPDH